MKIGGSLSGDFSANFPGNDGGDARAKSWLISLGNLAGKSLGKIWIDLEKFSTPKRVSRSAHPRARNAKKNGVDDEGIG